MIQFIKDNKPFSKTNRDNLIIYYLNLGCLEVPVLYEGNYLDPIWNGSEFIENATIEEITEANKPKVPYSVSNIQLRKALIKINIMPSAIGAMLQKLPQDTQYQAIRRELLVNMWEYENEMRRQSADIVAFGASLGLSSEKLDNLFILADTL